MSGPASFGRRSIEVDPRDSSAHIPLRYARLRWRRDPHRGVAGRTWWGLGRRSRAVVAGLALAVAASVPGAATPPHRPRGPLDHRHASTDLVDGQGGGPWPAPGGRSATSCGSPSARSAGNTAGGTSTDVVVDAGGTFATTLRPRCSSPGPTCTGRLPRDPVRVRPAGHVAEPGAAAAIAFDPTAPLLPPPSITADPAADLVDGPDRDDHGRRLRAR